jgi:hypothetical protein
MIRAHDARPGRSRSAPAGSVARRSLASRPATHLGPAAVLRLQRLAGNRAVAPVVQRACAGYERGERTKAAASAGVLGADVSLAGPHGITSAGGDSVVVADFPIGGGTLRPSTIAELRASWVGILERQSTVYEFVGYSDCRGGERNTSLRERRAKAVAALFPKTAARASAIRGAPVTEHAVDNTTPEERALNRSVVIRLPPATPPAPAPPAAEAEGPHVVVPRRDPDSVGCSRPEREMLSVAWPAAKMMIDTALQKAYVGQGSVNSYLLERYFGPDWMTHIVDIRAGYQRIVDKWFAWNPKFECLAQTAGSCPNADPHLVTLAYVKRKGAWPFTPTPYGNVHVCREGFLNSMGNLQKLSATVVHELSHRLDNTDDHAYCSNPPQCDIPTKKAIDNADSYAQYARTVFNLSI